MPDPTNTGRYFFTASKTDIHADGRIHHARGMDRRQYLFSLDPFLPLAVFRFAKYNMEKANAHTDLSLAIPATLMHETLALEPICIRSRPELRVPARVQSTKRPPLAVFRCGGR